MTFDMTILLLLIIGVLLIIIYLQHRGHRVRKKNIKYICEKVESIMRVQSSEKILLFTDDKDIQSLLKAINGLLTLHQKVNADFTKMELSMKKMLSNISHDLKTPLTVILGYMEMIIQNSDKQMSREERNKLLKKVHEKVMEILYLINHFFDLAKLESGDKDFPLSRILINEICRNNILYFYEMIQFQKLEVAVDIPEEPYYVLANKEALNRILKNLISNAITYGADGNIVGLKLRADDRFVYVDVWDQGKGINEKDKEHVFERMYTLEDSRNKNYQGSGLGLTITKRLVEQLGGDVTLQSTPFEKTTFSVKLKRLS